MSSDLRANNACLTAHVLDAATGRPAVGIETTLLRATQGRNEAISTMLTNKDGRFERPFLMGDDDAAVPGRYTLLFRCGNAFFGDIPVEFQIENALWHYHVPLVVSPYGFSTYRGAPPSHAPRRLSPAPLAKPEVPSGNAPAPGSVGAGVTVHAIDISQGFGAAGLWVELLDANGDHVAEQSTTLEGRTPHWIIAPGELAQGRYTLLFHLGPYFRSEGSPVGSDPFFPVAHVPFHVLDTTEHLHLPILISPWGYSSYRGS